MQLADVYVRACDVVTRMIGAETLIVPVRNGVGDLGSIYSLNELGSFIWQELAEPNTVEGIVESVISKYETTPADVRPDVERFLAEMCAAGLAEEKTAAGFPADRTTAVQADVQSGGAEISC
jgi:Coenzyme PQQ synthesis protein D (PqqD)